MSDSLPLPPRPNVEQYKKLAREFQQACKSGDAEAIRAWATRWAESLVRLQGLEKSRAAELQVREDAGRIQRRWRDLTKDGERVQRCSLADAQLLVARCHGFASWPKFTTHLKDLARSSSPVSKFEAAVNAVVAGDLAALADLLRQYPDLIHERSSREHRSTLLHYVSANGVEDFRQKTPKNIVEVARLLLEAGADVNAESDAYGGRSMTLGLTATSWHPEKAGVQLALMELLIEHGAVIDGPDGGSAVVGCLRNGRGRAAEMLAERGARLDLEGAAGVGRLDVVQSFFQPDGSLAPPATRRQLIDGFAWACQFGRTPVVELILRRGVDRRATLAHDGQTGLHWACLGGRPETVKFLLDHGARVDAADDVFGGTPLGWALYAWGNLHATADAKPYCDVIALLTRAGATLHPQYGESEERRHIAERMRADPRMQAALRGEILP